jgi:hypothetical protein
VDPDSLNSDPNTAFQVNTDPDTDDKQEKIQQTNHMKGIRSFKNIIRILCAKMHYWCKPMFR